MSNISFNDKFHNENFENYSDQTFENNSNQIKIPVIDNVNEENIIEENELLNNNSEYEQINTTLRNLHMHSNIYKNNHIHNDMIHSNNHPVYTDFYVKINSQLKNLHITNMKQHGKNI